MKKQFLRPAATPLELTSTEREVFERAFPFAPVLRGRPGLLAMAVTTFSKTKVEVTSIPIEDAFAGNVVLGDFRLGWPGSKLGGRYSSEKYLFTIHLDRPHIIHEWLPTGRSYQLLTKVLLPLWIPGRKWSIQFVNNEERLLLGDSHLGLGFVLG